MAEPAEAIEEVTESVEQVEEIAEAAPDQEANIDAINIEEVVENEAPALMAGGTSVSLSEAQNCFVNDKGDNPYIQKAVREIIGNASKAAATWTVGVGNILDFSNQALVVDAMKDYDNASDAAKDLHFIHLAFLACSGIGVHPDQVGTNQKLAAIECAYNNPISAAGNIPAKLIEAPIKAVAEVVKSVIVPPTKLIPSVVNGLVNATKSLFAIRW